jgi:hypothetical protein
MFLFFSSSLVVPCACWLRKGVQYLFLVDRIQNHDIEMIMRNGVNNDDDVFHGSLL